MTNEKLLIQLENRIKLLQTQLEELYSIDYSLIDKEYLEKEAKILKEIKTLEQKRRELIELLPVTKEPSKELMVPSKETDLAVRTAKKSNNNLYLIIGILTVSLAVTLFANSCQKKKAKVAVDTTLMPTTSSTATFTSMPTTSSMPTISSTPTPTITPKVEELFSDVTNEEQLVERAKKIYNLDLKPILEELNNDYMNGIVTEEKLMDIIRLNSGELPVNEEFDPNTLDEMYQFRAEVFGNLGSNPNLTKLYPVHYSLLAEDNSQIYEYAKSYDELYNAIAEARNNNDMESAIKNIQELGKKHYNEWVLGGLYGGYNPHIFYDEHKHLALAAADERYASYVLEYILDNNLTICIPACYNSVTGEFEEINVVDIEEAIKRGTSMNEKVSLSHHGDKQVILLAIEFYCLLENKLNSKVLKRG